MDGLLVDIYIYGQMDDWKMIGEKKGIWILLIQFMDVYARYMGRSMIKNIWTIDVLW